MSLRRLLPITLITGLAVLGAQDRPVTVPGLTELQKSALHKEVCQVTRAWLQAHERSDSRAVLAFYAVLPDFPLMYGDSEGKFLDFEGFQKDVHEALDESTPCVVAVRKEMLTFLASDTALWVVQGTWRGQLKAGASLEQETCAMSLLLKRVAGDWRIVFQHESKRPTQPVMAEESEKGR